MRIWEFLKHAVGGGGLTVYASSRVKDYVRQEDIPEREKPKYVGVGIGVVGGGVLGYWIGEEIADHERTYNPGERLISAAIGAAGGGAAGYVIASYLEKRIGRIRAGVVPRYFLNSENRK